LEAELADGARAEDQAVRAATEPEVAEFLALGQVVAGCDVGGEQAGRDLRHPDGNERQQPKDRVVGVDDDNGSGGDVREVGLRGRLLLRVGPVGVALGVVGPVDEVGPQDRPSDGAVPAVVVRRAEERLVDGAADELRDGRVVAEQVLQRVRLVLDPEPVAALDVGAQVVRGGLAGADDDLVVVGPATGRWPSRNRLVKKSFQDVNPQCGSAGSCSYCPIPTACRAASLVQPVGLSLRTYSDSGLLRNPHHSCRIALSAALTRGSRNAACPAGVPIAQSSTAPRGRVTV